ncbi:hypothetical protein TNCV_2456791 [Trichonephila clavipes]|nr:hypothetical protein TNCV_2456791 [Trichonephila clavipes]
MWFRLALNTSTPSVQILIGEKGNLFFRLWGLIQLLHIKNVRKHFHVFSCKHVLSSHRPYPKAIHNIHLVDIKVFFSNLQVENAVMRDLFLKALTHGYAHQPVDLLLKMDGEDGPLHPYCNPHLGDVKKVCRAHPPKNAFLTRLILTMYP